MAPRKKPEPLPNAVSWKTHRLNWQKCTDCPLHATRVMTVLYRQFSFVPVEYRVPVDLSTRRRCEILIIGEGPGESEDVTGLPFIGAAGKKLTSILREAVNEFLVEHKRAVPPTIGMTNIVACRPISPSGGNREPTLPEAEACRSRLEELIVMTAPTDIILAGKLPHKMFPRGLAKAHKTFPFLKAVHDIAHPASLLHSENSGSQSNRVAQTAVMRTSLVSILDTVHTRKLKVVK